MKTIYQEMEELGYKNIPEQFKELKIDHEAKVIYGDPKILTPVGTADYKRVATQSKEGK